jgi:hypothetical protein
MYRDVQNEQSVTGNEQEAKIKDLEGALQRAHEDLGAAQDEVNKLAASATEWEVARPTMGTEPDRRAPEASSEAAGDLPQMPTTELVKPVRGYSSLGASYTYKVKEADKVQVPDFPNLASLPQWRALLLNNLVQASGRPDDMVVMKWVQEALGDSKTFEELSDVGDMSLTQLDSKLCLAMTAMLTRAGVKAKDIRDKLNRHMLDNARKGQVMRGRQLAQLMLECLKTVDQSEAVYCLTHLADVAIVNDDLQGFLTKWNLVLDGLSGWSTQRVAIARHLLQQNQGQSFDDRRHAVLRQVAEESCRSYLRQVGGVHRGWHRNQTTKV